MKPFLLPLLFLGLFSSCLSKPRSQLEAVMPASIVKFQYFDNRIMVPIWINEQGPFHMVFDTGGSNVMMPEVARQLKIATQDAGMAGGAGDRQLPMQSGTVKMVRVGSLVFKDQEFLVLDLSPIKKAFGFKKFDGVVGYEWLLKYAVKIDYDNSELTFLEFDHFSPKGIRIPFELYGNKPVIPAKILQSETQVLVDTGDRSSFTLFRKYAATHAMAQHFGNNTVVSGYGVGGAIPAKLGQLPKLTLGDSGVELMQVPARLPTTEKGFFAKSDLGGSVGNGLMQNFVVSFNYKDKVMYLEKGLGRSGEYHFVPPQKIK